MNSTPADAGTEPQAGPVKFYDANYNGFSSPVYQEVRRKTYGHDLGQNSWTTLEEQDRFLSLLELTADTTLLDVACGSGGPSLYLAQRSGCELLGIDVHEAALSQARAQAQKAGLAERARFERFDAGRSLPLEANLFDAIVCIDAINHLPERSEVLEDWTRLLRPGGLLLFTDPIVVTGILSSEEIAIRSSIGFFLFAALDEDERLLRNTGLEVLACEDATENVYQVAARWTEARAAREEELRRLEGDDGFDGQQEFLSVAERLAREGRLSRFLYLARKPA